MIIIIIIIKTNKQNESKTKEQRYVVVIELCFFNVEYLQGNLKFSAFNQNDTTK